MLVSLNEQLKLLAATLGGVLGVTREREPSKYYIEQVKTKTTAQTEWSRGKNGSRMNDWIRNRIIFILFYSIYKEDT